jgi:hypothetical protein
MMVTKKKQRLKSRPFLWDINYTILNLWFIARGFSGFKDDLVYTSNYAVYLKEQSIINNSDIVPTLPWSYMPNLIDPYTPPQFSQVYPISFFNCDIE